MAPGGASRPGGTLSVISDHFEFDLSNGINAQTKSEDEEHTSILPSCRREFFAAYIALLWSVMGGSAAGWSAPALPILMYKARGAFWWMRPMTRNSSAIEEVSANGSAPLRRLSLEEASWVVAMLPLGALFSASFAMWMSKRKLVAPRAALLVLSPAAVAGWLLIAFAPTYECVLAGRALVGVTWGAGGVFAPAFVSSLPSVASAAALRSGLLTSRRPPNKLPLTLTATRDSTAALKLLVVAAAAGRGPLKAAAVYPATAFGTLLVAAIGAVLSSYINFTAAMALLPACFCLAFWFIPESPWYLSSVEEIDAAADSLRWYRGGSSTLDLGPELEWISTAIEAEKSHADDAKKQRPVSQIALCDRAAQSDFPSMFPRLEHLSHSERYLRNALVSRCYLVRPVIVSVVLSALHQLCGINAFVLYTCQIFDGVGSWVSGLMSAVVLSGVHFIGAVISSRFIDRLSSRGCLLSLSSGGMALSLGAFGVYSYFHIASDEGDLGIGEIGFVPIVSITTFMIFYSFGLGPLLPLAMAEALPSTHRDHLLPVALTIGRVISVALAKEVPIFIDVKKHYVVFGMFFGGFCAVCCAFVLVVSLCGKLRSKHGRK